MCGEGGGGDWGPSSGETMDNWVQIANILLLLSSLGKVVGGALATPAVLVPTPQDPNLNKEQPAIQDW